MPEPLALQLLPYPKVAPSSLTHHRWHVSLEKVPPLHLGPTPLGRGVIPLKNKTPHAQEDMNSSHCHCSSPHSHCHCPSPHSHTVTHTHTQRFTAIHSDSQRFTAIHSDSAHNHTQRRRTWTSSPWMPPRQPPGSLTRRMAALTRWMYVDIFECTSSRWCYGRLHTGTHTHMHAHKAIDRVDQVHAHMLGVWLAWQLDRLTHTCVVICLYRSAILSLIYNATLSLIYSALYGIFNLYRSATAQAGMHTRT